MARGKSDKVAPYQKLMLVMATGKAVTVEEIEATLGNEIHMYRLSTYIWLMKTNANAIVKVIKNGRKISAYQIVNVDEVKQYLKRNGVTEASLGQGTKITKPKTKPVTKLADLKAEPVVEEVTAEVEDEITVTEVTE
jgi:hypothetical protein